MKIGNCYMLEQMNSDNKSDSFKIAIFFIILFSCFVFNILLVYISFKDAIQYPMKKEFLNIYQKQFNKQFDMISSLYLIDSSECYFTRDECEKLYPFYEKYVDLLGTIFRYYVNTEPIVIPAVKYQKLLKLILYQKQKEFNSTELYPYKNKEEYCNILKKFLKEHLPASSDKQLLSLLIYTNIFSVYISIVLSPLVGLGFFTFCLGSVCGYDILSQHKRKKKDY